MPVFVFVWLRANTAAGGQNLASCKEVRAHFTCVCVVCATADRKKNICSHVCSNNFGYRRKMGKYRAFFDWDWMATFLFCRCVVWCNLIWPPASAQFLPALFSACNWPHYAEYLISRRWLCQFISQYLFAPSIDHNPSTIKPIKPINQSITFKQYMLNGKMGIALCCAYLIFHRRTGNKFHNQLVWAKPTTVKLHTIT